MGGLLRDHHHRYTRVFVAQENLRITITDKGRTDHPARMRPVSTGSTTAERREDRVLYQEARAGRGEAFYGLGDEAHRTQSRGKRRELRNGRLRL